MEDNEKIVGKAPGRNRIQDGGCTNMLMSHVGAYDGDHWLRKASPPFLWK